MQLGALEVLLILVIALLIFGPSRIPEIGRALGRSLLEFRQGLRASRPSDESSKPPRPST